VSAQPQLANTRTKFLLLLLGFDQNNIQQGITIHVWMKQSEWTSNASVFCRYLL